MIHSDSNKVVFSKVIELFNVTGSSDLSEVHQDALVYSLLNACHEA